MILDKTRFFNGGGEYTSYTLRHSGATEFCAKLGKSGRETLEMSEKTMNQKQ
jgi:hypothetical protein